jgi:DNA-binding MarR family transcriptional regulator
MIRCMDDEVTDQLERLAIAAVGLTARALVEAAPRVDLTFPQWRVLLILGERETGARVGEVARRVGVTMPATGRLLRRLAARDLVTLVTDETDRRATRATVTDMGQQVRSEILAYRRSALASVVAGLPPTAEDVLRRTADALDQYA